MLQNYRRICGVRARVELSTGQRRGGGGRGGGFGGRGGGGRDRLVENNLIVKGKESCIKNFIR